MSFNKNRLFLSTCLTVSAFSFSVIPYAVRAGFDWTPPEETKEVVMPDVPAPHVDESALPPVEDRSNQNGDMPVFEQPKMDPKTSEPVKMKKKVFSQKSHEQSAPQPVESSGHEDSAVVPMPGESIPVMQPAPEQFPQEQTHPQEAEIHVKKFNNQPPVTIETPAEQQTEPLVPVETEIKPEQTPAPQPEATTELEKPAPSVTPEPLTADVPPETASQSDAAQPKDGELSINPFPLQNEETSKLKPVSLPDHEQSNTVPAHTPADKAQSAAAIQADENIVYDVVEGFGAEIPLVMAMGQIIPAKYAYSFGKGVNPGSVVSWEGGKPWNEVLHAVLTPLNIVVKIEGTVVSLSLLNQPEQPVEAPVAAPEEDQNTEKDLVPAPAEEKAITPEPVVQNEKAEKIQEDKEVKAETLTQPPKEEDETSDAAPEEDEEDLPPLTEADKTKALQEEQLKKIQNSGSVENMSDESGNIIKQESERYNLSSSAQSEQKKNQYSASSIR